MTTEERDLCRMVRDGVRCDAPGGKRFVPSPRASLAGMQAKMSGRLVAVCDDCWALWKRATKEGGE